MATTGEELSEREKEILRLVATGASNKEIGAQLDISANTVKVHLRNIFAKMGVRSRTEASMAAVELGLVPTAAFIPEPVAGESAMERAESVRVGPEHASSTPVRWWQKATLILAVAAAATAIIWPGRPLMANRDQAPDPFSESESAVQSSAVETVGRWQELAQMPSGRDRFAVAVTGQRIVVVGGDGEQGVSGDVHIYDIATNTWRLGAPKPVAVSNAAAAVLDGLVYVPGGYTADGVAATVVEAYDPLADEWNSAPALPVPLCAYALATDGERLLLFGGWDGNRYVADVYALERGAPSWAKVGEMPRALGHSAAAQVDGSYYVVGGYDGSNASDGVNVFEPGAGGGSWRRAPQLLAPRAGLALVAIDDSLFALGGGWTRPLPFSEKLVLGDPAWQRWEGPVTGAWRNLGAVSSEGVVYAMGGWKEGLLPDLFRYQAVYRVNLPLVH